MAPVGADPKLVSEQLERILASRCFEKADKLRKLLAFLVEETLAGRGGTLRETRLGELAFDLGPDFDPTIDNIVRVQVGNLRKRLAKYYAEEGAGDEIMIEVPKGAYVPVFIPKQSELLPPRKEQSAAPRRNWVLVIAIAAALVLGLVYWARSSFDHVPRYTLVERKRLTYEPGYAGHPAPSPDGKMFAFTSDRDDEGDLDVWIQPFGGTAIQLTDLPGPEVDPDWSPDGKLIAFTSLGDARGIYVISLEDRLVRRLSDFGYRPRFSPDGKWIAFSGQRGSNKHAVFLVSPITGTLAQLPVDHIDATSPAWHPGGRHLVFNDTEQKEWNQIWRLASVTPGDSPAEISAIPLGLGEAGRSVTLFLGPPSDWIGDTVIFRRFDNTGGDLWAVPIALERQKLKTPPYLLMSGPVSAPRFLPKASPPKIIYSTETFSSQIYGYRFHAATTVGEPGIVVRDTSLGLGLGGVQSSLSQDGRWLAYCSKKQGSMDIVAIETASGREVVVANSAADETDPVISPAGNQVAYSRLGPEGQTVFIADVKTRSSKLLCSNCGRPKDWSADGSFILLVKDGVLFSATVTDGVVRVLFRQSGTTVAEASLDPKGRWVAVSVLRTSQEPMLVYLASLAGGSLAPQSDWIPIGSELHHFQAEWSVDGNWIYYVKLNHGYRCLWAQRVDPVTRRQTGEPVVIRHFHRHSPYPIGGARILAGGNLIALNLTGSRSDVWLATLELR